MPLLVQYVFQFKVNSFRDGTFNNLTRLITGMGCFDVHHHATQRVFDNPHIDVATTICRASSGALSLVYLTILGLRLDHLDGASNHSRGSSPVHALGSEVPRPHPSLCWQGIVPLYGKTRSTAYQSMRQIVSPGSSLLGVFGGS